METVHYQYNAVKRMLEKLMPVTMLRWVFRRVSTRRAEIGPMMLAVKHLLQQRNSGQNLYVYISIFKRWRSRVNDKRQNRWTCTARTPTTQVSAPEIYVCKPFNRSHLERHGVVTVEVTPAQ